MKKNKDNLYDYYFHFNHLTGYWNAIPRDYVNQYMNVIKDDNVKHFFLKNKDLKVLTEYICKNNGYTETL